ncbi:hypothetical protein HNY73_008813 [Argiope bruennichi]|uniref:Uncharacterized protein n=2 Tax=Argiope bruennichi TaxID=94029 RepID=A0A8T0FCM7_ARGBR|nr:hypothetical protein HNY73_008813 [Argiope bruennichi]
MEHQFYCTKQTNFDNEVAPIAPIATVSAKASEPRKAVEVKQKSPDLPKPSISSPVSKETTVASAGKQTKDNKTVFDELLKDDDDDDETPLIFEDNSQESGIKLMSYGSSVVKRTEEEKPSFRPPPMPFFDDQTEAKDTSVISDDDDAGESLEDFWRRAEIKNTQRLRKLKL